MTPYDFVQCYVLEECSSNSDFHSEDEGSCSYETPMTIPDYMVYHSRASQCLLPVYACLYIEFCVSIKPVGCLTHVSAVMWEDPFSSALHATWRGIVMWSSAADIDILRAEINFSYGRMVDTLVGARASVDLPMFPSNAILTCSKKSVKGKAIPLQALRVPRGRGSQISRQWVHEGCKFVSPTHRPSLPSRKYSWYSFLLEAESTPGR